MIWGSQLYGVKALPVMIEVYVGNGLTVELEHVAEAVGFRCLDRTLSGKCGKRDVRE